MATLHFILRTVTFHTPARYLTEGFPIFVLKMSPQNRTLFISYNPQDMEEQTLALRLHTIGAVNGFQVFLPDRYDSDRYLSDQTKARISQSNYFILFALSPQLSQTVLDEITYAWSQYKDKRRILVIYRSEETKSLNPDASKHFTEIFFDPDREPVQGVIQRIMEAVFKHEAKKKFDQQLENGLLALLGIGLGLAILNEFAKDE